MEKRKWLYAFMLAAFSSLLLFPAVYGSQSDTPSAPANRVFKHFVLVHGSGHGACSWYKLLRLLRSSGHNATAVDLAASGIDPKPAADIRSMSEYFQPLMDLMASFTLGKRVVLVGHSFGGLAISEAMERFPQKIAVAVFVTALMPGPSLNISSLNQESFKRQESLVDSYFTYGNGPSNPPTTFVFGPLHLATHVYQLSPPEDLMLAMTLVKPLRIFTNDDMETELKVSKERYSSVSRIYIVVEDDKLNGEDFQRWMIEKNAPEKVEVEVIRGADHMVMISKPMQLCHILEEISNNYS